MSLFSRATLQLTRPKSSPLLRGSIYFFITLALVIFTVEIVVRSPLGNHLPAPSVQADSFLIDAKIYQLEQQVRRDGRVDCIFIGSSVTNSDVDPQTVERVFREQTGETIHCYNLGAPAMTVATAAIFADAVIARFSPRLLVYTFVPRDIIQAKNNLDFIEGTPWFQIEPRSPQDWLIQNSYAYRYYQIWRYLLLAPNREKRLSEIQNLTDKGFQPTFAIREPYPEAINLSTDLLTQIWQTDYSRKAMGNFLSRQDERTHILLVEGPMFRDSADAALWQVYESDYIPPLESLAGEYNIPYLRSTEISSRVPKEHWYDQIHFNHDGALTFSEWLGDMLAEHRDLFQ